jgi:hypothetical protein
MTRPDTAVVNRFFADLRQAVARRAHGMMMMDKAGWHAAGILVAPGVSSRQTVKHVASVFRKRPARHPQ